MNFDEIEEQVRDKYTPVSFECLFLYEKGRNSFFLERLAIFTFRSNQGSCTYRMSLYTFKGTGRFHRESHLV